MAGAASGTVLLIALLLMASTGNAQLIDVNRIWTEHKSAVVHIRAFGTASSGGAKNADAGTGFLISPDGYILTGRHVVGSDAEWQSLGGGSVNRRVEVTRLDKNGVPQVVTTNAVRAIVGGDLALIRIYGADLPFVELAKERPGGFPNLAAIVWGPNAQAPSPLSGPLANTDVNVDGDVLTLQMSVIEGYSGSPVFDVSGVVVGLIEQQKPGGRALAEPVSDFRNQLPLPQRISPQYEVAAPPTAPPPPSPPTSPADGLWDLFMSCASSAALRELGAQFLGGRYARGFDDGRGNA
jgi:S1-C subfamily serine protease